MTDSDLSTLFDLLPIGAYRSSPDGRQLRANAALVRFNGYDSEADMLAGVNDIGQEWYVEPGRRALFQALIERDGRVENFRSEVYRHRSRERRWIIENAHLVRAPDGSIAYYEGTVEDVTQSHQAHLALEASERRFRALTERAQVLTVVCDEQTMVHYASPASMALLGRAPDTLLGTTVFQWMHPDDVESARRERGMLLAGAGTGGESVHRLLHADGSWRYLASVATDCLDDPAVRGLVLNFRDATERKRAEAAELALHQSEARWKLALEVVGDGIFDWDMEHDTSVYSRRFQEMYGFEDGELGHSGPVFDSRVHPEDKARRDRARIAHIQGLSPNFISEHRMRCKDGSWKWVLARGMVIQRDENGRALRMIGIHTDITQRKQAEQDLQDLYAELGRKTHELQITLGSISQGIFMIGPDGRLSTYNQRLCELLDLPESLLSARPTLAEITRFQLERGDFGAGHAWVDPSARAYVASAGVGSTPTHYLRTTADGRTLEVRSQELSDGGMVRTFADISDYVRAERSRERLHQLLQASQSLAKVGGWEVDLRTGQVYWTDEVYRMLETSPEEYTPSVDTTMRFFTPESAARVAKAIAAAEEHGAAHDLELEMVTAKGHPIWVHSVSRVTQDEGRVVKRTSVLQDITERKLAEAALQESEARWKFALEGAGDGVWDWYVQTGVEIYSRRCKEMYGYAEDEIADLASEFDRLTHPLDIDQVRRDRQAHFDGLTPTYVNEHRIRCKDGRWKWVLSRGTVISRDADGRPLRMIGTHTDITARKEAETLIWHQANFDTLTGLPNRRMLRDRLEQEIKRCDREGLQLAVLFIDLDHFKEVNDTLGHDAGDALLIDATRRIRACVRDSDTVARMGGDEFTILLTDLHDDQWVGRVTEELLGALSSSFQIAGELVYISASIGITIYPSDAREVEDLFKHADQALYVAKGAGRNRFSFFTPALQEAAQARVRMASDLRSGLAEQQFHVAYQPIVCLRTGAVRKAEALIRWQHPVRGPVSPGEFIPVAESTGLIVEIGDWVFEQVAQQAMTWRARFDPDFQISLNKSPVQFHKDDGHQAAWLARLAALGLAGNSLVVEITEGLLLDTGSAVTHQLLALRDAGVQVSLDDFGTGYSSLTYLQRLDIDFIKIDQSFVRHLVPDGTELALCKAIIVMAHELGMEVIAEGVETEMQRDLLAVSGCDFAQGFLFSRPLRAPEFETWLQMQAPARGQR